MHKIDALITYKASMLCGVNGSKGGAGGGGEGGGCAMSSGISFTCTNSTVLTAAVICHLLNQTVKHLITLQVTPIVNCSLQYY